MTPTTTETPAAEPVIRKLVPLDRITLDPSLQVRGGLDPAKVAEYQEIIREHGFMDPCDVFYEDPITAETKFYAADGFHRVQAYHLNGVDKIPCNLRVGTHPDALKFTLRKNGHHGVPMTNAQKRHAAEMAVLDPVVGEMPDKDIARMIGCSASLVNAARRGETPKQATSQKKAKSKRETESTAPRSATAKERKPVDVKPTTATILRQIRSWNDDSMVDEQEIVALFEDKNGAYRFLPKDGGVCKVLVVGKSGKAMANFEAIIKKVEFDSITVKYEGGGKVVVSE
jgi:ParB-like chromosome segregation protein Spo0J